MLGPRVHTVYRALRRAQVLQDLGAAIIVANSGGCYALKSCNPEPRASSRAGCAQAGTQLRFDYLHIFVDAIRSHHTDAALHSEEWWFGVGWGFGGFGDQV